MSDEPLQYSFRCPEFGYCIPIDLTSIIPDHGCVIRLRIRFSNQETYIDTITYTGKEILQNLETFVLYDLKRLQKEGEAFTLEGQSNFMIMHPVRFVIQDRCLTLSSNYVHSIISDGDKFLDDMIKKIYALIATTH